MREKKYRFDSSTSTCQKLVTMPIDFLIYFLHSPSNPMTRPELFYLTSDWNVGIAYIQVGHLKEVIIGR